MLVRKLKLPQVNYLYPRPSDVLSVTAVHTHNQIPWLCELGLAALSGKVITLQAWMPARDTTPIHRDLNPQGLPIPWTVLFCPVRHGDLVLRLYEAIDINKTGVQSAPSGKHGVPTIDSNNARLLEEVEIGEGDAIVFSPGNYYHSVENTRNEWTNAISIRSNSADVLGELESLLVK